jgi:sodium transport system permease protein
MNWKTVKHIFHRELRDQLRDRRTLFTIAVLPLLMYPLLGMVFLQMANFSKEHPSKIRIFGAENLPAENPLIVDEQFSHNFADASAQELMQLELAQKDDLWQAAIEMEERQSSNLDTAQLPADQETQNSLQRLLDASGVDCLVVFPKDFATEINGQLQTDVKIFAQASKDKSRIAVTRIESLLGTYRDKLATENLRAKQISAAEIRPFHVHKFDLSSDVSKRAAVWSRVLPFVVFIWALTGAFYPAIDLCAGEKERGTLETLLSSPASRTEIVWGKLLTVMTFSMGTSMLNLFSMSFTGLFVINSMARMSQGAMALGTPPFHAFGWLIVALVPLSALFSATSLAIASFARSSKEGQYYLMPILMISVPLMMLPMMPGAELDLGTSLIPISGLMLVLRALIENRIYEAMQFAAPVLGVTFCCCLLVIQWAVRQFNNEKVLFRESERVGIGSLFRNLVRERGAFPTFLEAVFCGVLLLVIRFFTTLIATQPGSFGEFARQTLILHVGMIIGPVALMAIILTTNPLKTLGLNRTKWQTIPLAILMAACLHPIVKGFQELVLRVYPMQADGGALQELMETIFSGAPSFIYIILLFALLPAISEELAFRGFIMNGLRQSSDRWTAILLSSLFFGATHGLLQQSIIAFFTGTLIGFISFQAGSILPAMFYHFTHNTVTVSLSQLNTSHLDSQPWLQMIFKSGENGGLSYTLPAYFAMSMIGISIFVWFYRLTKSEVHSVMPHQSEALPAIGPITV